MRLRKFFSNLKKFIHYITYKFIQDDCFESASALTYTTLLSIVPLMTVSLVVVKEIPYFQDLWSDSEQYIFRHFVPATGLEVQKYLQEFVNHAGELTMVGILFLIFSSMVLIYTIEITFNRIWGVRADRGIFETTVLYLAILICAPILMGLSFVLSSYLWSLPLLQKTISSVGLVNHVIRLTPYFITWVCFTFLYVLIPNCRVQVKHALLGGLLAAILFEIAKRLFASYVARINFNTLIYGTFATIPLFLFWLYISWLIILLGAQIASAISFHRFVAPDSNQSRFVQAYKWLYIFWQAQRKDKALFPHELFQEEGRLTNSDPYSQLYRLKKNGWVKKLASGAYTLSVDLDQITLYDFYHAFPWRLPNSASLILEYSNTEDKVIKVLYKQLLVVEQNLKQVADVTLKQQFYNLDHEMIL